MGTLSLRKHIGWNRNANRAALGLLLPLAVGAAIFAALPERYRSADFSHFTSHYPIRIDLAQVQALTVHRDTARGRAALSGGTEQWPNLSEATLLTSLITPPPAAVEQISDSALTEVSSAAQSATITMAVHASSDSGSPGVMAIDFDLEGGPNSASTLATSRDVQHDGEIVGQVNIRIDNNSAIYVAREDLLRTVPSVPIEVQQLQDEFILLSALRSSGVNLRYDPVSDKLVLVD